MIVPNSILGQKKDTINVLKPILITTKIKPNPVFTEFKLDSTLVNVQSGNSIDQALKFQTNLYLRDYGMGALSSIAFRGYNAQQTAVFWEGMPIKNSMNNTYDGSLFPLFFIENVALQYGAAGMINGGGGLGGSVIFGSNSKFKKNKQIKIAQSFSSILNSNTGLMIKKSTSSFISSTHLSVQVGQNRFNYINPVGEDRVQQKMIGAHYKRISAQQKLNWKLKKNKVVKLNLFLQNGERNLPHLTSQKEVNETQQDVSAMANASILKQINSTNIIALVGFRANDLNYANTTLSINDKGRERAAIAEFRIKYWLLKRFKMENALLFTNSYGQHAEYMGSEWNTQLNVQHLQQITYENGSWLLHGLFKTQMIDNLLFPLLPSIGLRKKTKTNWLILKANGAYHVMAPSLNDLYWGNGGNPNLLPESGWTSELIFLSDKTDGVNYSLTGFWSNIKNRILWSPSGDGLWQVLNVDKVTTYGFESMISYKKRINKNATINLIANYSYNNSMDTTSLQLPYLPKHRAAIQGQIAVGKIAVNYGHRMVSKRYLNTTNTAYLPLFYNAFMAVNYGLKTKGENTIQVGLEINNLYNEPYQEVANRPMPDRYFNFSIKYIK